MTGEEKEKTEQNKPEGRREENKGKSPHKKNPISLCAIQALSQVWPAIGFGIRSVGLITKNSNAPKTCGGYVETVRLSAKEKGAMR
jgi:hypothetical protein